MEGGRKLGKEVGVGLGEDSLEESQGPIIIHCTPPGSNDASLEQTTQAKPHADEHKTMVRHFKVVLLGEAGVGKTSLFVRIKSGFFRPSLSSTAGIDCCSTSLQVDGDSLQLSLYDTAGLERFRTLTRNYYRGAHAVLLVYSVDNPSSLFHLAKWAQDALEHTPTALKFLIGNKADLENLTSHETVKDFAVAQGCDLAGVVSAKTGAGLNSLLQKLGRELLSCHQRRELSSSMKSWHDESTHPVNVTHTQNHHACC